MMMKSNLFLAIVSVMTTTTLISAFPYQGRWSFTIDQSSCHFFSVFSTLYANSTISLQISSDTINNNDPKKIRIGLVVRTTPCLEEYFAYRIDHFSRLYYNCPDALFGDYGYYSVKYLKTEELELPRNHLVDLTPLHGEFITKKVKPTRFQQYCDGETNCDYSSSKEHTFSPSGNGNEHEIKNGYSITVPEDGIFLLVVSVKFLEPDPQANLTVDINLKSPSGHYLSAVDYPLLDFYAFMSALYLVFAIVWSMVLFVRLKDLLKIQFFIAAVIFFGMVEKAIFYGVYQTLNANGTVNQNMFYLAELVSCLKRTLARILILIVSSGFEIVRPHLGSMRNQIAFVGVLYFLLGTYETTYRIYTPKTDVSNENIFAEIPLALLDSIICWWIFNNLVQTTRALRLRRNCVKLELYSHLTNVLVFSVLASIAFMIWQIRSHTFTSCLSGWKNLWIDEAFWHVLFSLILLALMILWRPTNNEQRYAATTALLNDHYNKNGSQDYLIDEADMQYFIDNDQISSGDMKMRSKMQQNGNIQQKVISDETVENLKWIEENIPGHSSAVEGIIDSEEELFETRLEMSKIQ